jgi:glycosyltransferase involved in cell wall biosynthesis
MKKRILAISNHGAFLGGGEYSFLELLSNLRSTWEITSVVPEKAELAATLREKGIDTRTIPLAPLRTLNLPRVISCILAYTRLCAKYRPTLVYANGSRAAFYGGITGRLLHLPVVWHCRIADRDPYLDTVLCMLTSCIIANSKATATRFRRGFRHKIRVVYNGIDLQWLRDPSVEKPEFIRNDWKVILVIARASRDKRHDIILSSFEKAAKQDPNIYLVCVGSKDSLDPAWWDLLQERTQKSESKARIHWIGQVEDVRPWYKGAQMLVLASENESFGRVVVEAMAWGVPVIATRVGAIPEIVRDGIDGILITPGSANEVREAVLKLLRDESLKTSVTESGRKRAEGFSIERHVNKMVQVFEETLRHHARRVAQ